MFYKRRYQELKAEFDELKAAHFRVLEGAARLERAIGKAEAERDGAQNVIRMLQEQIERVKVEKREDLEKSEANLATLQAKLRRQEKEDEAKEEQQSLLDRLDECFGTGLDIEEAIKRGACFPKLEREKAASE